MNIGGTQEDFQELKRRLRWGKLGVVLVFGVLLFRIWQFQIHEGEHFRALSEDNRTRTVLREPARGLIYDRNGVLLANNVPSFTLYVTLEDVHDREAMVDKLATLIGIDEEVVHAKLAGSRVARHIPIKVKDRLTLHQAALIGSSRLDFPGVMIQPETQRNYPAGWTASHLLGYVGEVSGTQLQKPEFSDLHQGSIVGQYGVEASFDRFLRGRAGERVIEVDAHGHEKRTVQVFKPQAGDDLYLTIDFRLQKLAEELLGEEYGAIVALDPRNGEILALASRPGFDPNLLSRELTAKQWDGIVKDEGHPLTNRATQGQYPPGSTLKMVMAAAALETNTVAPLTEIPCSGGFRFGRRTYRDWKASGHGLVDIHEALVDSCDVFFYTIGERMGIETMAEFMSQFGLGMKTGIELPSEQVGLVPTKAWKERAKGQPWFPGETISAAIGQGFVTVTPIQMVHLTAILANSGVSFRPHIVRAVMERATGLVQEFPVVPRTRVPVKDTTFALIQKAMEGVVTEGTGKRAGSDLVVIAGKTGTAQTVSLRMSRGDNVPRKHRDHAWFVSYAPADAPRIATVVLVEHRGHGGSVAAPLAKQLIEAFIQLPPMAPVIKEMGEAPMDTPLPEELGKSL